MTPYWGMKRQMLSPICTTQLDHLWTVKFK
ncbi:DUF4113 domain-containing protein [Pseudomonas fragariae (ex Marin et al. 2024)]|nr:DUF4113 domain-containing protein [Pseudomonas amygdali]